MRFRYLVAVVLLTLSAAGRITLRQSVLRDDATSAGLTQQRQTLQQEIDDATLAASRAVPLAELLREQSP